VFISTRVGLYADSTCRVRRRTGSSQNRYEVMQLKLHKPTMTIAIHCSCAHKMSIRPIQVEVSLYLGQHR